MDFEYLWEYWSLKQSSIFSTMPYIWNVVVYADIHERNRLYVLVWPFLLVIDSYLYLLLFKQ